MGEVGGLGALENPVYVVRRAAIQVGDVHAIGHQASSFHILSRDVYVRKLVFSGQRDDPTPVDAEKSGSVDEARSVVIRPKVFSSSFGAPTSA